MREHSISKWTIDKARQVIAQMPTRMHQKDVGRLLGISPQHVHYHEVQAVAKIIKAFNVDIIDCANH